MYIYNSSISSNSDFQYGNNISIVMQGPLLHEGKIDWNVIRNIHETIMLAPKAELIVSTWECDHHIKQDILAEFSDVPVVWIWNKDPGGLSHKVMNQVYTTNINRMIVSSRQGLEMATRELVIKMRTDCFLTGQNFADVAYHFFSGVSWYAREKPYSVFSERVINCNLFARDVRSYIPYPFHPGDIFMMGRRGDVLSFFSAPLMTTESFGVFSKGLLSSVLRLVPEQYLWLHRLQQSHRINYIGVPSHSKEDCVESERFYLSNFIPLTPDELGMYWPKYDEKYHHKGQFSLYDHEDWLNLFRQYISHTPRKLSCRILYKKCLRIILTPVITIRSKLLQNRYIRAIAILLFVRHAGK